VTGTKTKKVEKTESPSSAETERLEREIEHLLRDVARSLKRIKRQSGLRLIRRPARVARPA
jgi:hypothetical protein